MNKVNGMTRHFVRLASVMLQKEKRNSIDNDVNVDFFRSRLMNEYEMC